MWILSWLKNSGADLHSFGAFPLYSSSSTRLNAFSSFLVSALPRFQASQADTKCDVMSRPIQESKPAFLNTNDSVTEIRFLFSCFV